MARLIDSSVFIEVERRGEPVSVLATLIPGESIALAAITASELLTGVHRTPASHQRWRRQGFVETVFANMPILPFDLAVAEVHARIRAQLLDAGQLTGAHDLLIAATALAHGYAVLTQNVRDFRRVPGLEIHQPTW